jgi:hypothetical protein
MSMPCDKLTRRLTLAPERPARLDAAWAIRRRSRVPAMGARPWRREFPRKNVVYAHPRESRDAKRQGRRASPLRRRRSYSERFRERLPPTATHAQEAHGGSNMGRFFLREVAHDATVRPLAPGNAGSIVAAVCDGTSHLLPRLLIRRSFARMRPRSCRASCTRASMTSMLLIRYILVKVPRATYAPFCGSGQGRDVGVPLRAVRAHVGAARTRRRTGRQEAAGARRGAARLPEMQVALLEPAEKILRCCRRLRIPGRQAGEC